MEKRRRVVLCDNANAACKQGIVDDLHALCFDTELHNAQVTNATVQSCCAIVLFVENIEDFGSLAAVWLAVRNCPFSIYSIAVLGPRLQHHAKLRLECFKAGAKMVTSDPGSVATAIGRAAPPFGREPGAYRCPSCGMEGLTENGLHLHFPLYHSAECNIDCVCPICSQACQAKRGGADVHIHNHHGPAENREAPTPEFSAFAWVVCRRPSDGRFIMVNEPAGLAGGTPGYWLPAGRVDAGEGLVEAAEREAQEEAGIAVRITGLIRFFDGPGKHGGVPRVVLFAEPLDPTAPLKSVPDFESCGAMWVLPEELSDLEERDYRSPDPAKLFPGVASGRLPVHPIDTSSFEAFEAALKEATRMTGVWDEPEKLSTIEAAWDGLLAEYPAQAFGR